jgi:hypothetical protein
MAARRLDGTGEYGRVYLSGLRCRTIANPDLPVRLFAAKLGVQIWATKGKSTRLEGTPRSD